MALKYKVTKKVFGFDQTNTERYVAQPVLNGAISYEKLCKEVNERTGAHRGQVSLIIGGMIDVMVSFIEEGMSIKLGEMGTFRPSFCAKSDTAEDGVSASNVYRRKLVFTPGKLLKDMLGDISLEKSGSASATDSGNDNGGGGGSGSGNAGGIGGGDL